MQVLWTKANICDKILLLSANRTAEKISKGKDNGIDGGIK